MLVAFNAAGMVTDVRVTVGAARIREDCAHMLKPVVAPKNAQVLKARNPVIQTRSNFERE